MIVGRKTFESIGKPLPGRRMIVLTRDPAFAVEGVRVAHDIAEALAIGAEEAATLGVAAIFVAGGGEIYRLFLDRADRLEITEVDLEPAVTRLFRSSSPHSGGLRRSKSFTKSADDEADFRFRSYVRR